MHNSKVAAALFVLSAVSSASASAQTPTLSLDSWAGCVWAKAPVSAQNWILALDGKEVAARPSSNPLSRPKDLLALRLDEACLRQLPVDLRGSIFSSDHSRMAKALQRNRPTSVGQKDMPMKVLVCEIWAENRLVMTLLNPEKRPKTKSGMKAVCFSAESDGSLTDA